MPIVNLRPTAVVSNESWATTANIYDLNLSTASSITDINNTDSLVIGATGSIGVNSWDNASGTIGIWDSATLNVRVEKTVGDNDVVTIDYGDGSSGSVSTIGTITSDIGSNGISLQTFQTTLNSADWGGSGFPNIQNLRVRVGGSKAQGADGATTSIYEVWVEADIPWISSLVSQSMAITNEPLTYTADGGATLNGISASAEYLPGAEPKPEQSRSIGLPSAAIITTSSGNVVTTVDDETALVGLQGSISLEPLTYTADGFANLSNGLESIITSGIFSIKVDEEEQLAGIEAVSTIGIFSISTDESVVVSGEEAISSQGNLTPTISITLLGQESNITFNSLATAIKADLFSVEITTNNGLFTIKNDDSVILESPFPIDAQIGDFNISLIQDRSIELTGEQLTLAHNNIQGYIVPQFNELLQSLSPTAILEFTVIDATALGGDIYYLHNGTNEFYTDVIWQGQVYSFFPYKLSGFETRTDGTIPRPKFEISNIDGAFSTLNKLYQDLIGVKVTRKRTFKKYLDAVNFINGNGYADPNAHFADDIYYIDRKSSENRQLVEFELASVLDLNGVKLPRRQVLQNMCPWKYRGNECGYIGSTYWDTKDAAVGSEQEDRCGKRLSSCQLRFPGNTTLPYGAFIGVGKVQ